MDNQRKKFATLIAAVTLLTFGWITIGTGMEEVPFVSIEQLLDNQGTWEQDRFRLGGLVQDGSIVYSGAHLQVDFIMYQEEDLLPIRFTGLTPDMFRDGAEVIIEGQLHEGVFVADNLMTKCASKYELDLENPEALPHEVY